MKRRQGTFQITLKRTRSTQTEVEKYTAQSIPVPFRYHYIHSDFFNAYNNIKM